MRSLSRFGLVLGLTFSDLEFCGNEGVGTPGVLRTSYAEGCAPHGPSFWLLSHSLFSFPLPHSVWTAQRHLSQGGLGFYLRLGFVSHSHF